MRSRVFFVTFQFFFGPDIISVFFWASYFRATKKPEMVKQMVPSERAGPNRTNQDQSSHNCFKKGTKAITCEASAPNRVHGVASKEEESATGSLSICVGLLLQ